MARSRQGVQELHPSPGGPCPAAVLDVPTSPHDTACPKQFRLGQAHYELIHGARRRACLLACPDSSVPFCTEIPRSDDIAIHRTQPDRKPLVSLASPQEPTFQCLESNTLRPNACRHAPGFLAPDPHPRRPTPPTHMNLAHQTPREDPVSGKWCADSRILVHSDFCEPAGIPCWPEMVPLHTRTPRPAVDLSSAAGSVGGTASGNRWADSRILAHGISVGLRQSLVRQGRRALVHRRTEACRRPFPGPFCPSITAASPASPASENAKPSLHSTAGRLTQGQSYRRLCVDSNTDGRPRPAPLGGPNRARGPRPAGIPSGWPQSAGCWRIGSTNLWPRATDLPPGGPLLANRPRASSGPRWGPNMNFEIFRAAGPLDAIEASAQVLDFPAKGRWKPPSVPVGKRPPPLIPGPQWPPKRCWQPRLGGTECLRPKK